MNEHIEEWKRFAAMYLIYVNYSFDRIVSDILKKYN